MRGMNCEPVLRVRRAHERFRPRRRAREKQYDRKELGLGLRPPRQGEIRLTSANGVLDFTAQNGIKNQRTV